MSRMKLVAILAVLGIGYVSIQTSGLTDLMVETLRLGPER